MIWCLAASMLALSKAVGMPEAAVRRLGRLAPRSQRLEGKALWPQTNLTGRALFEAKTAALKQHGRKPESCPGCWVHREACVCATVRHAAPVDVVVVAHRSEWGRASNTATVVAGTFLNARLLMKGLDDDELASLLSRPAALLWPEVTGSNRIDLPRCLAERRLLVVPDGSWRQAARIAASLPHVPRIRLPLDAVQAEASYLTAGPLRKPPADDRVGTALAVLTALRAMGLPEAACADTRHALDSKLAVVAALKHGANSTVDARCS